MEEIDRYNVCHVVDNYDKDLKERFRKNAEEYFDDVLKKCGVDINFNQKELSKIDVLKSRLEADQKVANKTSKKARMFKILAWVMFGVAILLAIIGAGYILQRTENIVAPILFFVFAALLFVGSIVLHFTVIKKIKKQLEKEEQACKSIQDQIDPLEAAEHKKTWPVTHMIEQGVANELIEKTCGFIKFEPSCTKEDLDYLKKEYGLKYEDYGVKSVNGFQIGTIFDNPFIATQFLRPYMGTKSYTGTKTIFWTESYVDSEGHRRTVTRSEVLIATIVKDYPEYDYISALFYGNNAAPRLKMKNDSSNSRLSYLEEDEEKKIHKEYRKLRKKEEEITKSGGNFTLLDNEQFEVAFHASRDNETEFRVMFTPLGQQETLKTMKRIGDLTGSNFVFDKNRKLNYIGVYFPGDPSSLPFWQRGKHITKISKNFSNVDANKSHNYNLNLHKERFVKIMCEYFEDFYFSVAPILSIPVYNVERAKNPFNFNKDKKDKPLSNRQYEEIINSGKSYLALINPLSRTMSSLKAGRPRIYRGIHMLNIMSHSYTSERRVELVPKFGGDGRMHNVPVTWDEYLPLDERKQALIIPLKAKTYYAIRDEVALKLSEVDISMKDVLGIGENLNGYCSVVVNENAMRHFKALLKEKEKYDSME